MRYLIASILTIALIGCNKSEQIVPKSHEFSEVFNGVINDEINGVPIVVYGNSKRRFLSVFKRIDDEGNKYTFESSDLPFPDGLQDNTGKVWSVFGFTTKENKRVSLQNVNNLVGYWFCFPAFHKSIQLYNGRGITNTSFDENSEGWLIDRDFVFAGSIKDGIKSIDNPVFIRSTSKELIEDEFYKSLDPEELVTVVQVDRDIHLYPQRILEYHEVVNDKIDSLNIVVSFCPLTGTSRAWVREFDGLVNEYGVSGLLFNNNLILYDRQTDSNWSQIFGLSVSGQLVGKSALRLNTWEIKAEDISRLNGKIKLLTTNTGIDYNYSYSIYPNYKFSESINFPLTYLDNQISPKERVVGVTIGDNTKVYRFSDFSK